MAEDRFNPLNNPGAEPVTQARTPREGPPEEANAELEDFLDDIFTPGDEAEAEAPPAADVPPAREDLPSPEPVGGTATLPPAPTARPTGESHTPPAPVAEAPQPTQDDLQRQTLELLNEQLKRMAQPEEPEAPAPESITPDQLYNQYQPRIQQYVEAGWLDDDFVSLYPKQAALMVHMWDMGTNLQQGVRQTQQFTEAEQERRTQEEANRQLDTAMNEVAARGDVFGALSDDEVKRGFREFLITEVNPRLSQVNPDFLARQFYAYNHQLIFDTVRQGQAAQSAPDEPTAAQLARQEGAGARSAPATPELPEFADLLQGHPAARWYE